MNEVDANKLVEEFASTAASAGAEKKAGEAADDTDARVARAVTFLQNPRLESLTLEQKILFLAQKQGLNREEIALSIAQLQPSEDEVQESMAKATAEAAEAAGAAAKASAAEGESERN
jgi:hypothetical protein